MRIATLVLGLVLSFGLFMQSLLVNGLSDAVNDEASEVAGALGLLAAFLWLVAAAVVIPAPRAAMALYLVAAVTCFAGASDFPDLAVWGVLSLGLAVFALFGWRGKRKADAEKRQLLMALQAPTAAPPVATERPCPTCATMNPTSARFCATCGAVLAAGAVAA